MPRSQIQEDQAKDPDFLSEQEFADAHSDLAHAKASGTGASGTSADISREDHVHAVNDVGDLADVDITSPANGEALVFNGGSESQVLGAVAAAIDLALTTNYFSLSTLSVKAALEEIDDALNGTSTYTFTGATFLSSGDDIQTALLALDQAIDQADIQKEVEKGVGPISSGTAHTLPGSLTYTLGSGDNLDVYLNGQLLVEGATEDYTEFTTTSIKFTFTVGAGTNLTYMSRM